MTDERFKAIKEAFSDEAWDYPEHQIIGELIAEIERMRPAIAAMRSEL